MKFIDIHCHIDTYGKKLQGIVKRAEEKGVGIIVNNGINVKTNRETLELSSKFPEVKAALGIYPIDALAMTDKEIDAEIKFIQKNKNNIFFIGEVGIDLKESSDLERQKEIFLKFIVLAIKLDKPLTIHSRKAEKECIEVLEEMKAKKVIMHCFSGNMNLVKRIVDNGWFLSIPANVKYSEHFQNVVRKVDIKHLFCETDSPYLHPDKLQNNEPANVIESYKKIAEIKGLRLEEVKRAIWENWETIQR